MFAGSDRLQRKMTQTQAIFNHSQRFPIPIERRKLYRFSKKKQHFRYGNIHTMNDLSSRGKNGGVAQDNSKAFHALFLAWQLGFLIAVPIVAFLLLGIAGDRYFHTRPLLLILGLFVGMAVTVYEVYCVVIPLVARTHDHAQH
jgi:F0F1-type ATP synthase assembly protein I